MAKILNNKVRKLILRKLMFSRGLTFSELSERYIDSNRLAYHLKKLENEKLIKKCGEKFILTDKGKDFVSYIDASKVIKTKQPLVVVFDLIKNGDKILIQKRLKQPFYGYHGLIGGKVEFGQTIFDTFMEEAKSEAGIVPKNPRLVCAASIRTYDKKSKKLLYHHLAFVIESTKFEGKVIERTEEGENHWYTLDEIKKKKIFPDLLTFVKASLSKNFKFMEMTRYQDGMKMRSVRLVEYI